MNELRTMHLFAGIGGGLLADLILGHRPVVAVEWEPYACQVLRERAAEGWFHDLSVWEGDVRMFDPSEYAGKVDCIHAGFPCQPYSVAGVQAGIDDPRGGDMWNQVVRIGGEIRPEYIFLENVSGFVDIGLSTVIASLTEIGYDSEWICLSASDIGAPHYRERWWCLATRKNNHRELETVEKTDDGFVCKLCGNGVFEGCECDHGEWQCKECNEWTYPFHYSIADGCQWCGSQNVTYATSERGRSRSPNGKNAGNAIKSPVYPWDDKGAMGAWNTEPILDRVANGVPNRVHRLKGLGNAQVPLQAAVAWKLLGGE